MRRTNNPQRRKMDSPGRNSRKAEPACDDAGPSAIQLLGVSKSFTANGRAIEVLKNVNLAISPQAIVGLIGASGSGKSTLLNIISGILRPDQGRVCVCG